MQLNPELSLFIGRFHPLFVHLPIGLLSFALVLHLVQWKRPSELLQEVVSLLWLLAALSGGLSVLTGLLLSQGGDYENQTLSNHKLGGIAVAVLSLLIYISYRLKIRNRRFDFSMLRFILIVSAVGCMLMTGHWGGSLTHGSSYLTEYAPFGKIDSLTTGTVGKTYIRELDSAYLFEDAVVPILQAKCVSCHNQEKKKGDYLLGTHAEILAGGKTSPGVVPGNLATSELYRRISLPQDHKEFMPTDGKTPLTEEQKAILEWWIETGAHQQQKISALAPGVKIKDRLISFFQLDREAVEGYEAAPANPTALRLVLEKGFQVNLLTKTSNLLEVKFNGNGNEHPDLSVLQGINEQLVWLQLENCQLKDEQLNQLGSLTNLYKLNLNRNPITDQGLKPLTGLQKLEYLNLYGTKLTNDAIPLLTQLPLLKKLYLWDTNVKPGSADSTMLSKKQLELVIEP
ncbi:DUF2231 domain-containing protein [Flavihumibacter sp. UBA7668]|uniref:DUF2231 domain-containing protein n=1 Tax=Flavihumibacter sp. UBA7668 TaxID=1946542 RepID=UPI0025BD1EB7|nr:DUF2231 domain-containing protein [Flavihumibacter sp. UBA7668]